MTLIPLQSKFNNTQHFTLLGSNFANELFFRRSLTNMFLQPIREHVIGKLTVLIPFVSHIVLACVSYNVLAAIPRTSLVQLHPECNFG